MIALTLENFILYITYYIYISSFMYDSTVALLVTRLEIALADVGYYNQQAIV